MNLEELKKPTQASHWQRRSLCQRWMLHKWRSGSSQPSWSEVKFVQLLHPFGNFPRIVLASNHFFSKWLFLRTLPIWEPFKIYSAAWKKSSGSTHHLCNPHESQSKIHSVTLSGSIHHLCNEDHLMLVNAYKLSVWVLHARIFEKRWKSITALTRTTHRY